MITSRIAVLRAGILRTFTSEGWPPRLRREPVLPLIARLELPQSNLRLEAMSDRLIPSRRKCNDPRLI